MYTHTNTHTQQSRENMKTAVLAKLAGGAADLYGAAHAPLASPDSPLNKHMKNTWSKELAIEMLAYRAASHARQAAVYDEAGPNMEKGSQIAHLQSAKGILVCMRVYVCMYIPNLEQGNQIAHSQSAKSTHVYARVYVCMYIPISSRATRLRICRVRKVRMCKMFSECNVTVACIWMQLCAYVVICNIGMLAYHAASHACQAVVGPELWDTEPDRGLVHK
jgi:hypothetical protein